MSLFGKKPEAAPVGVPSRDGDGTVELVRGARIVRRPIFTGSMLADQWQNVMLDRITVAKSLGFTMFEIDVTGVWAWQDVPANEPLQTGIYGLLGMRQPPVEGDEWKSEELKKARQQKTETRVITVYALVVE